MVCFRIENKLTEDMSTRQRKNAGMAREVGAMKLKLFAAVTVLLLFSVGAQATIISTTNSVTFTCAASIGPYAFTFPAYDASSFDVIQTVIATTVPTTLSPSQYTSAPVNNSYMNGGSVTLNVACPTGDTLTIQRMTEQTQTAHFTEYMPALYQTFEQGLDKLTMEVQDGVPGPPGPICSGCAETGASNTWTAPQTCGTGCSWGYSTGSIDASALESATWDKPLDIGYTTPARVEDTVSSTTDGSYGSAISEYATACETSFGATTLNTGGTTTTTGANCLPANSIIDGVTARVTTAITGSCTGWELGDGTTAARFSANNTGLSVASIVVPYSGTAWGSGIASQTTGMRQGTAGAITVTCAGGDPTAGAIRIIVYSHTLTSPTS